MSFKAKNRIENRRIANEQIWAGYRGYVNGQAREPFANMHLGPNRVANVGCETIAIYNALTMLGKKTNLPEVIYEIECNHLTWFHLGGVFGVNPHRIAVLLNRKNIGFQKYTNYSEFILQAKKTGKPCIMGFRLNDSLLRVHTVSLYWDRNKWVVYNVYNNSTKEARYADLTQMIQVHKFMVGYVLG